VLGPLLAGLQALGSGALALSRRLPAAALVCAGFGALGVLGLASRNAPAVLGLGVALLAVVVQVLRRAHVPVA
jgi:hypothetical protein